MNKNRKLSIILMTIGIIIYTLYIWWAINKPTEDIWGFGIWIVAVVIFGTGVVIFTNNNEEEQKNEKKE